MSVFSNRTACWLIAWVLISFAAIPPMLAQSQSAAVADRADPTEGWITTTRRGDIVVYYDRNPDQPVGCSLDDDVCDIYLELAGGLTPGQRKRMPVSGGYYDILANGDISLLTVVAVGPHTQQIPYVWRRGTPQYLCYQQELVSHFGVGQHIMTLGSRRRIEQCLANQN